MPQIKIKSYTKTAPTVQKAIDFYLNTRLPSAEKIKSISIELNQTVFCRHPSLGTCTGFMRHRDGHAQIRIAAGWKRDIDVLRTLFHELRHVEQVEDGSFFTQSKEAYEQDAVSFAAHILSEYNKVNPIPDALFKG